MPWSPSRLSVLDIKLLRDAMRLWPQFLAIALVLASGVATLILSVGAYRSLEETRSVYYDRYRFADIFAQVVRAPHGILPRVLEIPGIAAIEARIVNNALLDIVHVHEPATGMVISLPDKGEPQLNRLHVRQGRLPEPGRSDEVTVNEAFAKAIGASIGDRFEAILNGRKRALTIVGFALSPEYIYAIGPGDLMPDNRRFAVMWMSEAALAAIFDLEGAFNAISLKLSPGATEVEVIRRLDALLERYGGTGAFARREQLSHAFLDAELQQLRALSRVIPPIFLFVTAFLINMTLTRLIALEREQIGLLKAVGYGQAAIATHYLKLVAVIASAGIAIGYGLGTWFGQSLTQLYGKFFQFPFLVFERDPDIYLLAGAVSLTSAILGAAKATRQALLLPPAVAMQPPAPARFKPLPGEARGAYALVSQMTMMSLRSMMRWPVRSALTALGLALSGALLVVSLFGVDSVESMVDVTFFQSERQQATVTFVERKPIRAVEGVGQLPGVLETEPFRSVSAHIRHGHLSRRVSIMGRPPQTTLSRALDLEHRPVPLPETGLLINRRLSDVLGIRRGDVVDIEVLEGRRGLRQVVVADVIESYFGLIVLMRLDALNAFLDEGSVINGVHIAYDTNAERDLFRAVKRTPAIASIALQPLALKRFRETLAENINMMTSVYIGLSIIVAFGVVYNSARVQLSERARDLASLRVLGFTDREVSRVLLTELTILTIVAQPLAWGLGYAFGWLTIQSFSSDLYTTPLVIETATYAKASLVVIGAAAASALVVGRRVKRLDLISVLKTRD